jgi:hypothetical protein
MTKVLSFALIAFHAAQVSAFAPSSAGSSCRSIGSLCLADGDAQALSDYMAKSHEEKLRAVKDIEDKKNSEIAVSSCCVCKNIACCDQNFLLINSTC